MKTEKLKNKVTDQYMDSRIESKHYFQPYRGSKMTLCEIILDNGFSVVGEAACVDPKNYDQELGEFLAYQKAYDKLWALFGFMLAEQRMQAGVKLEPVSYDCCPAVINPESNFLNEMDSLTFSHRSSDLGLEPGSGVRLSAEIERAAETSSGLEKETV